MTRALSTSRPRGGAASSTGLSTARLFAEEAHQPFLIRWVSSVTWS